MTTWLGMAQSNGPDGKEIPGREKSYLFKLKHNVDTGMKKENMSANESRLEIKTFLSFREAQEQNTILITVMEIKNHD